MKLKKEDWSYSELAELGIEVCTSCGGSNINVHYGKSYCLLNIATIVILQSPGITTCMPDDDSFYSDAEGNFRKNKKGGH